MTEADAKTKLLTLADLDGRTRAAQAVSKTISALVSDLGGNDHLSTGEHEIVKSAAMTGAMLENMAARWLTGEPIDPGQYATLSNAQRRLLETVGLRRRSRDVTPSLSQYLASKAAKPAESPSSVNPTSQEETQL
ncbi:hypothetical protein BF49_6876 [Bradyrhizobium sp.]|uniref:hypothetical protein n=1 Tax=Bradyrhizobium sp. TaxID=376 RepID=UPI0007C1B98D|nr:hypothetical protein [Bradyrhizobium sp.]CUT15796.1 hypothetical protein BF49_6876 [Bradyrhizobium sp.]